MILIKLKFYTWLVNFYKHFAPPTFNSPHLLASKDRNNLFSSTINAEINENLPTDAYWTPIRCYFNAYPSNRKRHLDLDYLIKNKISDTKILYKSLACVFGFWYWFPECISGLKKYYPVMDIPFSELEFRFIDFWIEVLPIFEDCLGHLLVQDTPFLEPKHTKERLYIPSPYLIMQPPIKEDLDFSQHLENYYFGEGSDPVFLDVITAYLENRPELKNKCTNAWENAKTSNLKVPSELAIYFVCNYLIKNISKYTLRFVVANTPVSEIRPIKKLQNALIEKNKAVSPEILASSLRYRRKFLLEKQAEKKIFEETGFWPQPSEEDWRALDDVLNEIFDSMKPPE